jgi:hypothetical protein
VTTTASGGSPQKGPLTGTPPRDTIYWHVPNLQPYDTVVVSYKAMLASGASAAQSLFAGRAWVRTSDTLLVTTNPTYHQGAGVSIVTFLSLAGGSLFNAGEQALDYKTSPRSGVRILPDSGYAFAGWSHDAYRSLRGDLIPADSGIMNYDSLVIYGNVELRAVFTPLENTDVPEKRENSRRIPDPDTSDWVWSGGDRLYVRSKRGASVHIYTPEGILRRHFVTDIDGVTSLRLVRGIYFVTLNNNDGYKIAIN